MKKYKIKEYKFDDGRIWYKAFRRVFIFWHPLTYCWAIMNWTSWCQSMAEAEDLIKSDIREHTKSRYKIIGIKYL